MKKLLLIATIIAFSCIPSLAAQQNLTTTVPPDAWTGAGNNPAVVEAGDVLVTTEENLAKIESNTTELYTATSKAEETWHDDTVYPLGKKVSVGLDVYTCTAPHLSVEALTKPGTGSAWTDAWTFTGKLLTQAQADEIAANTLKVGITSQQASDITANNAKVSYPGPQDLSGKQDTLVSGTNIKTINGADVTGSGNIVIAGEGTGDMVLATPQVVTGAKTFDPSTLGVKGSGTGKTTFTTANSGAVDNALVFPAESGNIARVSDIPSVLQTVRPTGTGSTLAVPSEAAIGDALADKANASSQITVSANIDTLLRSADYAAARTNLSLVPGTNVQAYDADLTTYAGITPSANVQSYLGAANYSAMRTLLGLVIGTNVQAYNANLTSWAAIAPSAKQDVGTYVTSTAALSIIISDDCSAETIAAGQVCLEY